MSAIGVGTSILVGKNGADLRGITVANGQTLTWTHGLGTKQGFGGRAVAVRVFSYNAAAPGATTGQNIAVAAGSGMLVTQPETILGNGIFDTVVIENTSLPAASFDVVVEVVWEYGTAELDLIIGNRDRVAPGVTDAPYASTSQPAGTFGRFVFS